MELRSGIPSARSHAASETPAITHSSQASRPGPPNPHSHADDSVDPQLRAVTAWVGLCGSLAIWAILATLCFRLF
jgi:hypothetical protein